MLIMYVADGSTNYHGVEIFEVFKKSFVTMRKKK